MREKITVDSMIETLNALDTEINEFIRKNDITGKSMLHSRKEELQMLCSGWNSRLSELQDAFRLVPSHEVGESSQERFNQAVDKVKTCLETVENTFNPVKDMVNDVVKGKSIKKNSVPVSTPKKLDLGNMQKFTEEPKTQTNAEKQTVLPGKLNLKAAETLDSISSRGAPPVSGNTNVPSVTLNGNAGTLEVSSTSSTWDKLPFPEPRKPVRVDIAHSEHHAPASLDLRTREEILSEFDAPVFLHPSKIDEIPLIRRRLVTPLKVDESSKDQEGISVETDMTFDELPVPSHPGVSRNNTALNISVSAHTTDTGLPKIPSLLVTPSTPNETSEDKAGLTVQSDTPLVPGDNSHEKSPGTKKDLPVVPKPSNKTPPLPDDFVSVPLNSDEIKEDSNAVKSDRNRVDPNPADALKKGRADIELLDREAALKKVRADIDLLHAKKEGFHQMLVKAPEDSVEKTKFRDAFRTANKLVENLHLICKDFVTKEEMTLKEFQQRANASIEEAHPVLDQHRGYLKNLLVNLLVSILTLVVVHAAIAAYKGTFFVVPTNTDSNNKLKELSTDINAVKI